MITNFLLFVFVGIVCIWAWDYIHREKDDPETVGTLLVINDGEETYLFLDTDKKPEEFTKYKEVIFKVETRNQQAPL